MRIGIDLGGTKIEGIALTSDGVIASRVRVATPREDYEGTVGAVRDVVAEIESTTGAQTQYSVGIGIPGIVSPRTGLVKNANSTWLIGKPLDRDLVQALARDVRIENDANCFALSEASDGAGAGASVVFGVILGTGVGGGIVVNGQVVRGRNAIAGEWGHNDLTSSEGDPLIDPPRCYCGRHGCIETYLSGPGLSHSFSARTGEQCAAEEIVKRAEDGDEEANKVMRLYEERLARSLGTVINVLDPDVIVLGGGLSNVSRLYQNVPRLWDRWIFSDAVDTVLQPPVHGDSSGVRGAAWLWPDVRNA